ncbi:hypothetical protein OJ996_17550 [Luteolibacter sp. GHJ8]|uniref:FG-GAP repeat protein n=1 Tax=Luteolibacter rhizosphaerae TaxID=2989719 RepID=A0ABT3G6C9_9BACT|nr:hypothetical protein [Luteolibacter rhizosphaerae]MCW1915394.1 hypothetical protein [Luteolibacter rhizosphaerae]
MKSLISLLVLALTGLVAAAPLGAGKVPEGLSPADWSAIRAAHEAAQHAPQRADDGCLRVRNPGQQWHTEFDGKGFTVTPDDGAWTWGLDLTGYGDLGFSTSTAPSQLTHEGGRISCQRDGNLTEWFINDSRGLEQGWDIRVRPERADPGAALQLHLSTRGSVLPRVNESGDCVSFHHEHGGSALSYGGLKAWDAEGKKLPVRFEQGEGRRFRIAVEDQGARYPITIDPIAQQAYLKANHRAYWFGDSVAISGNTVVIGASIDGYQTGSNSGTAFVFTRSGGVWTQQARLKGSNTESGDLFGRSVAISGDTLVVGAIGEDSSSGGVGGNQADNSLSSSGAAYVFTRSGTTWTQQAYIKGVLHYATGVSYNFGNSVAIEGDLLAVGAPGAGAVKERGAVCTYIRSGGIWTEQSLIEAHSAPQFSYFGQSVAISNGTLVVGASRQGVVYVYTHNGAAWGQQAYLKVADFDGAGASVGISGDTLVTGARSAGAAYVFTRSGTSWTQQASLRAGSLGGGFGSSVGISGDTVVVGADGDSSNATGVNGNPNATGAEYSGAAWVFHRNGTTWTRQAYLKASNTGAGDGFGEVVAIGGDTVVIGAKYEDSSATGVNGNQSNNDAQTSGAVYVMHLNPAPFEIAIEENWINISLGGTKSFGPVVAGGSSEVTLDLISRGTNDLILTGDPKITLTGSSDFTVTAQPSSPVIGYGGRTTFKVRFTPTGTGPKAASLSMPTSDGGSPLVLNLSGTALSFTTDTDGDGMSDAAEFNMAALNFDWQVNQSALVDTYLANANKLGFFTPAQVAAFEAEGKLIAKDPVSGRYKITMDWKKSTDLSEFIDLPASVGSSVSFTASRGIQFEFASPEDAAFFWFEQD